METKVSKGLNETAVAQATTDNRCEGKQLHGLVNLIKSGAINDICTGIALKNNETVIHDILFEESLFFSLPPLTNDDGELIDTTNLFLQISENGEEEIFFCIGNAKYYDIYVPVLDGKTADGRKIIDGGETVHKDIIDSISYYGLAETYLDNYDEMLLRPWHQKFLKDYDWLCADLLEVMEIPYIAEHIAQYEKAE